MRPFRQCGRLAAERLMRAVRLLAADTTGFAGGGGFRRVEFDEHAASVPRCEMTRRRW